MKSVTGYGRRAGSTMLWTSGGVGCSYTHPPSLTELELEPALSKRPSVIWIITRNFPSTLGAQLRSRNNQTLPRMQKK